MNLYEEISAESNVVKQDDFAQFDELTEMRALSISELDAIGGGLCGFLM